MSQQVFVSDVGSWQLCNILAPNRGQRPHAGLAHPVEAVQGHCPHLSILDLGLSEHCATCPVAPNRLLRGLSAQSDNCKSRDLFCNQILFSYYPTTQTSFLVSGVAKITKEIEQ